MEGSTSPIRLSRPGGEAGEDNGWGGSPLDSPWPQLSPFPNFLWGSWAPVENYRSTPLAICFFNYLRKGGGDGYNGDKKAT